MYKVAYIMGNFVYPFLHGTNVVISKLIKNTENDSIVFSATPSFRNLFNYKEYGKLKIFYFTINRKLLLRRQSWTNFSSRILKIYLKKYNSDVVVGVYPSLQSLELAYRASMSSNLPFIPYLHDTLLGGKDSQKDILDIQSLIFKKSCEIAVISNGLKEYYEKEYSLRTHVISHIYDGKLFNEVEKDILRRAVFIGDVYNINDKSIIRIFKALNDLGDIPLFVTNVNAYKFLLRNGVKNLKLVFFEEYHELISFLRKSKLLINALNWPDETEVHVDELKTIFPTKSIEYLASGGTVIVHAPSDYYVSRFFNKNKSGIIIDTRDFSKIKSTLAEIVINDNFSFRHNALKLIKAFMPNKVKKDFYYLISLCLPN